MRSGCWPVFCGAGLQTLADNADLVVSESHLEQLITASVRPVIEALPADLTVVDQLRWQQVADALMGPAAQAALTTIANHPVAFLGEDFAADRAVGALTQALLKNAADSRFPARFDKETWLGLYSAALGVAADRPGLFVRGDDPDDALARDLLTGLALALQQTPPPFDGEVGIGLARAALTAISTNAGRFADATRPWQAVAADLVTFFTRSMSAALGENASRVLSRAQWLELGRIVFTAVAESPALVLGRNDHEFKGLVSAIAGAISADEQLLLGGKDWLVIVQVAAEEAATNPDRLFGLTGNPDDVLAGQLLRMMLTAASTALGTADRADRFVLYGQTLRDAVIVVLRATAGQPQAARDRMSDVARLVDLVTKLVANHPQKYGSKEWLRLFRLLLSDVLAGGALQVLTESDADALLERSD